MKNQNLKNINVFLYNLILFFIIIFMFIYLDTTTVLLCQGIENNGDVVYFGVEPTASQSAESMYFMQKSESSVQQQLQEQREELQWSREIATINFDNDFVLYSDGSFVSEDMIVAASSVPSEYGSPVPSNFTTESGIHNYIISDKTINVNILDTRIHPALRTDELFIHKRGLVGKAKLCFDSAGSNVVRVYVKYHDISKRKFLWHLWEKNRSDFESYAEFKEYFDPKLSVFNKIKKDIKTDLKTEIKELLHTKDPFERRLNNRKVDRITPSARHRR